MHARPAFLITIDTEGDNVWSRQASVETRNAEFLPRFQELSERFGFKPTYLTNNEMARSAAFQELARASLAKGTAEIGMHLHAWDSPPLVPLTEADSRHHPYLVDYPVAVMRDKISQMTDLLEDTFCAPMRSHRAGRWAFNETYAKLLVDRGYRIDCSVTPGHSWGATPGAPGTSGTDYTGFPDLPYFVDLEDIGHAGASQLLEVPVTIRSSWLKRKWPAAYRGPLRRVAKRVVPELQWLRPDGTNLANMLSLVDWSVRTRRPCLEFMIHSSELMPGGSPYFVTGPSIERLYDDLEALFNRISACFCGNTLSEFYTAWVDTAAGIRHGSNRSDTAAGSS